jgi:cardiolipin synthase C
MRAVYWTVVMLLAALGLTIAAGVARMPDRPSLTHSNALPASQHGRLDTQVSAQLAAHAGQAGFHLIADGVEAFALRAASARSAERSLDVQYYIWEDDSTGRLLVRELVQAADRGVRVRLLLDDLHARAHDFALTAMDAHPNIEVRIYNPFASRRGWAGKLVEALTAYARLNHRMHNKVWIADNRVALSGGRNVGDEYFAAAARMNFVDLDLATIGAPVAAMSADFDTYWNSRAVWPIATLSPERVDRAHFAQLRQTVEAAARRAKGTPYARELETGDTRERIARSLETLHWTSRWQAWSDDPMKALVDDAPLSRSAVLRGLMQALERTRTSLTLISGYFVPGEEGTRMLQAAAGRGVAIRALTNSLAANDVAAVHGGYAKYREPLLASGIALWELKPDPVRSASQGRSWGSSGASLHTKAAVLDRQRVFIGSFNLDPRSIALNCEQGLMVDHPALSHEVEAIFARVTEPARAYRVRRGPNGELTWSDERRTFDSEPEASWLDRCVATVMSWLPVESQL